MPPILLRGEFDPFQVAIIVIAVIAGFIKWLWENWQLKREAASRDTPVDAEERRLREAAWRKQTGQGQPPPIPTVTVPSPWEELRKAWKELQETGRQSPAPALPVKPATPPPMPTQRQVARTAQPVPTVSAVMQPAAVTSETYFPQQKTTTVSVLAALHNLRREPALMRQAILMHEILGPPKALQSSADFAI